MKLSVVVPCYNEGKDIASKSAIILAKLKDLPIESELILVNDGSKDNTKEEIAKIKMNDLNATTMDAAVKMIAGSCRAMGVTVKD